MTLLRKLAAAAAALSLTAGAAFAGSYTPGPVSGYVAAYDEISTWEYFEAGEQAYIELEGDCASDIDLWIYDENGNLVAKSTGHGCYESVVFTPLWDGEFEIRIENQGKPNGSDFVLITY